MRSTKISTATALAAVGVLAAAGLAHGATVSGSSFTVKHNVAITKGTFNVSSLAKQDGGRTYVHPIIRGGDVVVAFEAGATGQGPYTQEDCDRLAGHMNDWANTAQHEWANDNYEGAVEADNHVQELEEGALNGGCFIVYKEGPPPPEPEPEIG